jgi:hypothetical protein
MNKQELISVIKDQVEIKFNKGKSQEWKNREFEYLSFEILKSTHVSISVATLKRIFGKVQTAEDYSPQEATIEALIKYCGKSIDEISDFSGSLSLSPLSKPQLIEKGSLRKAIVIVCIIISTILLLISLRVYTHHNKFQILKIKLIKIEGANQASTYFSYINLNKSDSVFFDPGYIQPYKTLVKDSGKLSFYYEKPGLFFARLFTKKGAKSDSVRVFVPTIGWLATCYYFKASLRDRYFPINIEKYSDEGSFHSTPANLAKCGIDTSKLVICELSNFKKTNVNADSFQLDTRIKNTGFWPGSRCNQSMIALIGENGKVSFQFLNPGCSHWIEYFLSEKRITDVQKDVSIFARDISRFSDIKIINRGRRVSILLDGKLIFSDQYSVSLGKIMGVTVQFTGSGFVKRLNVKSLSNKEVFAF